MANKHNNIQNLADQQVEPGMEAEFLHILREALDVGVSIIDSDMKYRFLSDSLYDDLHISKTDLKVGDPLEVCHNLMIENGMLDPSFILNNKLSPDEQRQRVANQEKDHASQIMQLGDGSTHRFVRKVMSNGYTVSMANDISDLVEKDKMLEDALRLGHAGYWILDLKTQELTMSESLQDEFSDEDHALIAERGILAMVHPDDMPVLWNALSQITTEERQFQASVRIMPKDGQLRWHQVNAELMQDQNGQWNKVRAFVRDVTKYRTQAKQLEKAKDEAIAASRAKSQFLANMSHEIRTPLNGVMGMAELLARTDMDGRQKEFLGIISESAQQLLMIINDILDFSRVEAGAMRIDSAPVNLRKTVNDVAALIAPLAREHGLEIIVNYPQNISSDFLGDNGRIRQILTNLIGNAVKFTDDGYVSINVKLAEVNDEVGIVIFEIKDTGIGIPDEKLKTIFSKFTQVDNSTTRVHGGTGLGLSISKSLIELMRGKVTVESDLGKGSKFTVYLPLPYDPNATIVPLNAVELRGKRALIVDDIEINRRILSEMLAAWDMTTITASNASSALAALKSSHNSSHPVDIIISDNLMPNIDGRSFAAACASDPALSDIPIIMLSSCDSDISKAEQENAGIADYLIKPVRSERLFEAMTKTLSRPAIDPQEIGRVDDTLMSKVFDPHEPKESNTLEVLVAEDLALNRDVVTYMLAGSGFDPVFVGNGKKAVELYGADPNRFSVILMDISMPVMDGYEASARIRNLEIQNRLNTTPIIALTGHALAGDREKVLAAGLDDYISKPVRQDILINQLEKWTSQPKRRANAVA